VSPQSSVLFHPAVFIVVLRLRGNNKLIFGAMPKKIPGVWGQSPQGAQYRIRKLSDFRIGYLAFPSDGRSPASGRGGGTRMRSRLRLLAVCVRKLFVRLGLRGRHPHPPPPSPASGRGGDARARYGDPRPAGEGEERARGMGGGSD
jgi:hypothetical protein